MSIHFSRTQRVANQIKQQLAQILQIKVNDPRFREITITNVKVSPDMSEAFVYVSLLNESKAKEVILALNKASGFFHHQIASLLDLRRTPHLKFIFDDTLSRGSRLSNIIDEATKDDQEP